MTDTQLPQSNSVVVGDSSAQASRLAKEVVFPRVWLTFPRRVARFLLGVASANMLFNLMSNTLGYRGLALFHLAAALIALTIWLRGLPPRVRLARYAPLSFFVLSGVASAFANAPSWSGGATVCSAALALVGVSLAATLERATKTLATVAGFAAFLAIAGGAVVGDLGGINGISIALSVLGLMAAFCGLALRFDSPAAVGAGTAFLNFR